MRSRFARGLVALALIAALGAAFRVRAQGVPTPRGQLFDSFNACGSASYPAPAEPLATGQTFECDYFTELPVNAGGASAGLTLSLAAPAGTIFTGFVPGTLPSGCTGSASGATLSFSGCMGTLATHTRIQMLLLGGPTPGTILMTVAYNGAAPGPAFTLAYQFMPGPPNPPNGPGPASVVTQATNPGSLTSVTCVNTSAGKPPTSAIFVGDTFSCSGTIVPKSASFVSIADPNITLVDAYTTTSGSQGYFCGSGPGNAQCGTVTIAAMAMHGGGLTLLTTLTYLGGSVYSVVRPPIFAPNGGPAYIYTAPMPGSMGAVGCAASSNPLDIAFPASGNHVTGTTQLVTSPPIPDQGYVPGALSAVQPGVSLLCGAVFEDSGTAELDQDPTTIDGGTITYSLSGSGAFFLDSTADTANVNCGSTGGNFGNSGLDSCSGALSGVPQSGFPAGSYVTVNPGNTVRVAVRPGAVGGNVVTLTAKYTRYLSVGPAFAIAANAVTIPIVSFLLPAQPPPLVSPPTGGNPPRAAIGCSNATNFNNATTINFPTTQTPLPALASAQQNAIPGVAPAVLDYTKPDAFVTCGAVFENTAGGDLDGDPATIDGGYITYTLLDPAVALGGRTASILESGSPNFATNCGDSAIPGIGMPRDGRDSCSGGVDDAHGGFTVSPANPNLVHLGTPFVLPLASTTASGPRTAAPAQTVTLIATYTRYPALGPPLVLTTQPLTIPVLGTPPPLPPPPPGTPTPGPTPGATPPPTFGTPPPGAGTPPPAAAPLIVGFFPATVTLHAGCNPVSTPAGTAPGAPVASVVSLAQPPGNALSAWAFSNAWHGFQAAWFAGAGAPAEVQSVNPGQSLVLCVNAPGTFPT